MRSDVPLGAFLSGGIDSSLIVALMQQHSVKPIKTFSIGFPIAEYDETSHARHVAEHLGTEHHEFVVTPDGVDILPKLVWHFDEPFADSSAIPTWYVSQMTRRHVTVALSGDGGDELFTGYPRYRAVWFGSRLDRWKLVRGVLAARFWQRLPGARQKSLVRRFKRFSEFLAATPQRRYLEWIAIFHESRRAALYRDDFVARLPDSDPFHFLQQAWHRAGDRDSVTAAGLADLTTYLPCDILHKVDMASMAHSLECRQPFLDYRVVEFAASLPIEQRFSPWPGKADSPHGISGTAATGNLEPSEDGVWRTVGPLVSRRIAGADARRAVGPDGSGTGLFSPRLRRSARRGARAAPLRSCLSSVGTAGFRAVDAPMV